MFEQQLHGREIAETGGMMQRRGAGAIARIDEFGAGGNQLTRRLWFRRSGRL